MTDLIQHLATRASVDWISQNPDQTTHQSLPVFDPTQLRILVMAEYDLDAWECFCRGRNASVDLSPGPLVQFLLEELPNFFADVEQRPVGRSRVADLALV